MDPKQLLKNAESLGTPELDKAIRSCGDRIQALRTEFTLKGKWETAEQRSEWDTLNTAWDVARRERSARSTKAGDGIPGREDTAPPIFGDDGERRSDVDMALAGWCRASAGQPVPPDEARAVAQLGQTFAGGLEISLREERPIIGQQLRFAAAGEKRAQSVGTDTAGGYTVPEGFIPRLEQAMKDFGPMLRVAEVQITKDGRPSPWPTVDDTTNTGALLAENAQVSEDDIVFGATTLAPVKFTSGLVRVSNELLTDSAIAVAEAVAAVLGERLGRIFNTYGTTGTGTSQPQGIVTGSTLGVTAAAVAAITMDELINLFHSVDPAYREGRGVGWMMNDSTAAAVRKLKDSNNNYLWQPSNIVGQPPTLLGKPVHVNNDMGTMATGVKSVLFGDLSKYKVRIVSGIRLLRLTERYADFDQHGFVGFLRADGRLLDAGTAPVKHLVQA